MTYRICWNKAGLGEDSGPIRSPKEARRLYIREYISRKAIADHNGTDTRSYVEIAKEGEDDPIAAIVYLEKENAERYFGDAGLTGVYWCDYADTGGEIGDARGFDAFHDWNGRYVRFP